MVPKERCGLCRYWNAPDSQMYVPADCRRHAPTVATMTCNHEEAVGRWPKTSRDDWCGDWKAKENPDASVP